jgi:hypothetical protein
MWQNGTAVGDGVLRLRALNDDLTSGINAITFSRSGIASVSTTIGGSLILGTDPGGSDLLRVGGAVTAASVAVAAADYVYWGPAATDGTWRYGRSGNDFVIQRRESGSYVTKQTIAA